MNLHYDSCQFDNRKIHPVSAETKISWQDFSGMKILVRKERGERRLPTPEWAMNDKLCRQVIALFMERRAAIRHNPHLLPQERLAVAIAFVKRQRPRLQATVLRLSEEFRQCTGTKRRAELQSELESLDTFLRMTERNGGADFVAGIIYLYYRAQKDSVGVADALGIKPPLVRQTLWRLSKCWNAIQNPKPARVTLRRTPVRLPRPKLEKSPRPLQPWEQPEVLACVAELRNEGNGWQEICSLFDMGDKRRDFTRALKRAGYVPPVRKPPNPRPRKFDYQLAAQLRADGMFLRDIAKRCGVSLGSIEYAIKKAKPVAQVA